MFITTNCINRYVSCTCTKFLWRHVHASVDGWLIIVLLVVYMCCAYWTNFPVTRDTHMDVQYAHNCSFGLLFSYFLMTGCFIFCHPQTQAEKKKKNLIYFSDLSSSRDLDCSTDAWYFGQTSCWIPFFFFFFFSLLGINAFWSLY